YLPHAEEDIVEEAILDTLTSLTTRAGKPDSSLVAASREPVPSRRAAAGFVLGRSGDPEQRRAARRLLRDPDARVRWRAAQGLLAGRDRHAVPALIDLLAEGPADI